MHDDWQGQQGMTAQRRQIIRWSDTSCLSCDASMLLNGAPLLSSCSNRPGCWRDAGLRRWCDPSVSWSATTQNNCPSPGIRCHRLARRTPMPVQPLQSPVPSRQSAPHRVMSNVAASSLNASLCASSWAWRSRMRRASRRRHAVPGGSVSPASRAARASTPRPIPSV